MEDSLPDFGGKTLLLFLDSPTDSPLDRGYEYMVSPYFQRQGDRLFLVGRHPDAGSLTIGVPWSTVRRYVVASSLNDFRRLHRGTRTEPPQHEV